MFNKFRMFSKIMIGGYIMNNFYEDCLKRAEANQCVTDLNWDMDSEAILLQLEKILKRVFEGTEYYAERNRTFGEKDVDIFKGAGINRIGHLWPRKRNHVIHVNFTNEICDRLSKRMELPKDSDVKPGRNMNWRAFKNLDFATAMKIVNEVAKLD